MKVDQVRLRKNLRKENKLRNEAEHTTVELTDGDDGTSGLECEV
jgi:hypothetical protein